jgi:hypothetical protein
MSGDALRSSAPASTNRRWVAQEQRASGRRGAHAGARAWESGAGEIDWRGDARSREKDAAGSAAWKREDLLWAAVTRTGVTAGKRGVAGQAVSNM